MSKVILDVYLKICLLLHMPVPIVHREGIKLPKIYLPTFDSDVMNWRGF